MMKDSESATERMNDGSAKIVSMEKDRADRRQRSRSPLPKSVIAGSSTIPVRSTAGLASMSMPRAVTPVTRKFTFEDIVRLMDRIKNLRGRPWKTAEILRAVQPYYRGFDQKELVLHVQMAILGLQASWSLSTSALLEVGVWGRGSVWK